jgi:hypothetical protein
MLPATIKTKYTDIILSCLYYKLWNSLMHVVVVFGFVKMRFKIITLLLTLKSNCFIKLVFLYTRNITYIIYYYLEP